MKNIFLIIFLLLIFSCKKERMVGDYNQYIGEYEWLYTAGGFAPMYYSPETEKFNLKLKIKKSGRCYLYKNNEEICKGIIDKMNGKLIISLKNKNENVYAISDFITKLKNDTLMLGGGCCDKQQAVLKKIN